jgi:hypothetical protein
LYSKHFNFETPQWQSKTVELQNFISEQASHHFVFCYRKVDWQRVESAQALRMMAHLKFKFELLFLSQIS